VPLICSSLLWLVVNFALYRRDHSEEYRKHMEKDAALERRFQPVMVGDLQ